MFLQVIESNLQTGLVYRCRIPTAELLRNMLLPTQDFPSPTCLLDDSNSELSLSLPTKALKIRTEISLRR